MEEFKKRMLIEYFNLMESISRLSAFKGTDVYKQLSESDQLMLNNQERDMIQYSYDLNSRITSLIGPQELLNYMGCPQFDFGTAIRLLKEGRAVARLGWNGKNMFIIKQVPAHIDHTVIPGMQSLPQVAKDLLMQRNDGIEDKRFIDYTNQMLIVNAQGRADSWVASSSDTFATDWIEIKPYS